MDSLWTVPRRLRSALFTTFASLQNATRHGIARIRVRQAIIIEHAKQTRLVMGATNPTRNPTVNPPQISPSRSNTSPKRSFAQVETYAINFRPTKRRSPSPPEDSSPSHASSSSSNGKRSRDAGDTDILHRNERPAKRHSPSPPRKPKSHGLLGYPHALRAAYRAYGPLKKRSLSTLREPTEDEQKAVMILADDTNNIQHNNEQSNEEEEERSFQESKDSVRQRKEGQLVEEQTALQQTRMKKEEAAARLKEEKAAKAAKKKRLGAQRKKLEREASEKSLKEALDEYKAWVETFDRFDDITLEDDDGAKGAKKHKFGKVQVEEKEVPEEIRAPLLASLSDAWEDKVNAALAVRSEAKIMGKSVEGVELSRKDLGRLLPPGEMLPGREPWLNDEVINAWYANLCARLNEKDGYVKGPNNVPKWVAYSSAWFKPAYEKGVSAIQTWSRRKGIKGDKILQAERIFFPTNSGMHWTLLTISGKHRTIEYYDSLNEQGHQNKKYINLALAWLKMELGAAFKEEEWTVLQSKSSQQTNSNDCGVFACLNGYALVRGRADPSMEFGADDIPFARRMFVATLLNGGFAGDFDL